MNYRDFTPVVRGIAGGGFGVLTGIVTGATGAMIFSSTECGGFFLAEATKISAIGEGILFGTANTFSSRSRIGFFKPQPDASFFQNVISSSAQVGLRVFGGMLGYVIEKYLGNPDIKPNEMAAIILIGATVLVIPMWIINMKASQEIISLVDSISKTLNQLDSLDNSNDLEKNHIDENDCTIEIDDNHPLLMK